MHKIHQGSVDINGNFRDISRSKEGYLVPENNDLPFPALVVAWYPKSQTIDVNIPTRYGQTIQQGVVVYGNFFEATGSIYTPKIVTQLKTTGYTTIREDDQKDSTSDNYVLNNNIEALVFKTSYGYAASCFRFLTSDSPLLNNVVAGRKISRHDDGSYYIHDEDGNMQFKHPSGFNIKVGSSPDDIDLDTPFPEHEKNVLDYADSIIMDFTIPSDAGEIFVAVDGTGSIKISHPAGSTFEIANDGKFDMLNATTNLKKLHDDMNAIVAAIVVNNGTGPNLGALTQLLADTATLLKQKV